MVAAETPVPQSPQPRRGPLSGIRVVEFAGLGPGPFAAMLLSDLGADVLLIDRPGQSAHPKDVVWRGRGALELALKQPETVETCLAAMERADVLIQGFRPGVLERPGLGPEVAMERNPRLIYARMTGLGQDGPQSDWRMILPAPFVRQALLRQGV